MRHHPYDRMVTAIQIAGHEPRAVLIRVFRPRWFELGRWLYWWRLPAERKLELVLKSVRGKPRVRAEIVRARQLVPRDGEIVES